MQLLTQVLDANGEILMNEYTNKTARGSDMDKSGRQPSTNFARDLAQYLAEHGIPSFHILVTGKESSDALKNRCSSAAPRSSQLEDLESRRCEGVAVIRTEYSNHMACANQDWVSTDGSGRDA